MWCVLHDKRPTEISKLPLLDTNENSINIRKIIEEHQIYRCVQSTAAGRAPQVSASSEDGLADPTSSPPPPAASRTTHLAGRSHALVHLLVPLLPVLGSLFVFFFLRPVSVVVVIVLVPSFAIATLVAAAVTLAVADVALAVALSVQGEISKGSTRGHADGWRGEKYRSFSCHNDADHCSHKNVG